MKSNNSLPAGIERDSQQHIDWLMQERFLCIADFPDAVMNGYIVGEVQDRDWTCYVNGEDDTDGILWKISDYPHLFRRMHWWEGRNEDVMPNYIKDDEGAIINVIAYKFDEKWTYYGSSNGDVLILTDSYTPATLNQWEAQEKGLGVSEPHLKIIKEGGKK